MPVPRIAQRSPLHDLRLPLPDRSVRQLAREGWTADDVREVQELCGLRTTEVLDSVQRGDWPDRTPRTVLAWLRAGGQALLEARDDPARHRRQVLGMACWSRTFGELGPLAHAAGLGLGEAAHLLAAGQLTAASLAERAAGREPSAVHASWADALRPARVHQPTA